MKPVTEMTIEELVLAYGDSVGAMSDVSSERILAHKLQKEILDEAKRHDQALREKQELIGV